MSQAIVDFVEVLTGKKGQGKVTRLKFRKSVRGCKLVCNASGPEESMKALADYLELIMELSANEVQTDHGS